MVVKAPAKVTPVNTGEVDPAAGLEGSVAVSGYVGAGAQTPKAGGGGMRLGGAAEASQARRMKAVIAAANSQVCLRICSDSVCRADNLCRMQYLQERGHRGGLVQQCAKSLVKEGLGI